MQSYQPIIKFPCYGCKNAAIFEFDFGIAHHHVVLTEVLAVETQI